MSVREAVGLVLVIAGVAIAPFAYWVGLGLGLVALALAAPGFVLMFLGRKARNSTQGGSLSEQPDTPPGHELQGFHGTGVLDSHDTIGDADSGH